MKNLAMLLFIGIVEFTTNAQDINRTRVDKRKTVQRS